MSSAASTRKASGCRAHQECSGVRRIRPQRVGDFGEKFALALEEAEFLRARAFVDARLFGHERLDGIFRERAERGAGQAQAGIVRHLQTRDQPEALRVALEAREVLLLVLFQHRAGILRDLGVFEPHADGVLAGVAERRIAEIVRERGGGDDGAEIRGVKSGQLAALARSPRRRSCPSERPTLATSRRMREPRADVIVIGQREDLGLVLQAAKAEEKMMRSESRWKGERCGSAPAVLALPSRSAQRSFGHCMVMVVWSRRVEEELKGEFKHEHDHRGEDEPMKDRPCRG